VLMGLPAFSMAMIAMDSVFLPTAFLLWLGAGTGRVAALLRRVRPGPARDSEPEPVPVDPSAGGSAPVPGQGRPPAWAEAEAKEAKEAKTAKEATEPAERA
jgi:hypothetical protein